MTVMTVSRTEHDVLSWLRSYEREHGVAPTRSTADRLGYTAAISALARRGYVSEPTTGLGRVELTLLGRQAVSG